MNKNSTNVANNASSETVTVVGIDLAKNVFAIHGINAFGKAILVNHMCDASSCLILWHNYRPASSAWRAARRSSLGKTTCEAGTVPLLQDQLRQNLGEVYSDDTIRRALHRVGYVWKRPRYVLMPDPEREKKTPNPSRRVWFARAQRHSG